MKFIGNIIGVILGVVSLICSMIAFIPLLGWLNWFVIPFSIVGLIVSSIFNSNSGKWMSTVAIFLGAFRLFMGGGVV